MLFMNIYLVIGFNLSMLKLSDQLICGMMIPHLLFQK
jgi:hypothetical protein